jgi:sugar (pentulose or hexulose) kinase
MKTAILTIDIGSTNMKAVLFDRKGGVVRTWSRSTRPEYLEGRRVEMDARKLRGELIDLLGEANAHLRASKIELAAIGLTAQRSSVVPVDTAGEPLAPIIMWHDKRTAALCDELHEHEERVFTLSGMTISPVYSAVKMLWIRRHWDAVYRQTAKLLGIQDLALHTLCGRFVTDTSMASSTNLLNIHTCRWDPELLAIFNVARNHLCDLIAPGEICGRTTQALSRKTGIPVGIPVISAGGDQQCGAVGQGVLSPGKIKCTTGTGSYLLAFSQTPVIDAKKRFVCKVGAIPGTYCLEAGIFTTGTVYRWFVEQFYKEVAPKQRFELINREVAQSPAGANGVLMLPHFEGSGAPYWNPADRGSFYNIKLSTTRGDMARAILEAIVMETRDNIQLFKAFIARVDQISVAGGMTAFPFYNQLQADIFGTTVVTYPNPEATALGAWIAAAMACNWFVSPTDAFRSAQSCGEAQQFTPIPEQTHYYAKVCARRQALYRVLRSLQ